MSEHEWAEMMTIATVMLSATTIIFASLWIVTREKLIRATAQRGDRSRDEKLDANAELDRLMNMVDTIAVEVERISEGQRFTAKVLAERLDAPAVARKIPEKSITPH